MPHKIRVTTTALPNAVGPTVEANLSKAQSLLEAALASRPDVLCLPEVFATCGVPYDQVTEVAQPVPGAITDAIASYARCYQVNIICPLLEQRGDRVYNSAVLLDRQGQILGVYEKIHPLPDQDCSVLEKGVAAGREPKVFETDAGRVGILICFDINWPDEWAALKRKGAQIVFWPSAYEGGLPLQARAQEHQYYVVSATTMLHARIIDITGRIIAETGPYDGIAEAQIDLEKRVFSTDFTLEKVPAIRAKYGRGVSIHAMLDEDLLSIESNLADVTVDDIVKEFGLQYWVDYISHCAQVQDAQRPS